MAESRVDSMECSNDQMITVSDDEENDDDDDDLIHGDSLARTHNFSHTMDISSSLPVVERSTNDASATSSRSESTRHLSVDDVLSFLRANNFVNAETVLRQEAQGLKLTSGENGAEKSTDGFGDLEADGKFEANDRLMSLADVTSSSSLPELYRRLVLFVDKTDPAFSPELSAVLPAAFMHVHLNMVRQLRRGSAVENVYDKFAPLVPQFLLNSAPGVKRDLSILRRLRKPEDIRLHPIFASLVSSKYIVNLSRSAYDALKGLLLGPGMVELLRLLAENLYFDNEDRKPRSTEEVSQNYGALLGEARSSINKQKMFIGLPKELTADGDEEATIASAAATTGVAAANAEPAEKETEKLDTSGKKSKKRKAAAAVANAAKKTDPLGVRKLKLDQNAPDYKRIPLAPISVSDKLDRIAAQKEYKKAARISSSSFPSICFYTILNSDSTVSSTAISNDSSLLACGFTSGAIKVWTLQNQRPLRVLKNYRDLAKIPADQADMELPDFDLASAGTTGDLMLSEELMDSQSCSDSKHLIGHHGSVLDVEFSPSRHWLISAGQDGEIRLWSLLLWKCLTIFRGHVMPVTSVCFSPPPSIYFVSGGMDRTVRVWNTEYPQAIRISTGHHEDVTCVTFHPNCNYVASGSCDRTVRIWDVLDGNCIRMFSSHKDAIQCIEFSPCGQLLASGDQSGVVCLFKLLPTSAALCATLSMCSPSPTLLSDSAIYSVAFSRDSNALAVGSGGCFVAMYMIERFPAQQPNGSSEPSKQQQQQQQQSAALAASLSSSSASAPIRLEPLTTARTKLTPVHVVHFTRRNLLFAAGPIDR